jgi:four helix bundle protein
MPAQFDHEKLRAYHEAVRFASWVEPVIEQLSGKLAAKDQLDRASTSIVLNIAEGNGKRSHPDRCRYLDIARGSALECAACLDVLVVRKKLAETTAVDGKKILLGVVSLLRFSGLVQEEEQAPYEAGGTGCIEKNETENQKEND